MEYQESHDFRTVTLVDRTGRGGTEIIFDGIRIVLPRGKSELTLPRYVAQWLFRTTQQMVWTADGRFVSRFGIKDIPEDLAAETGPEAGDCSAIELGSGRVEGWDTSTVDRGATQTISLNLPKSALNERQGTLASAFADRKE